MGRRLDATVSTRSTTIAGQAPTISITKASDIDIQDLKRFIGSFEASGRRAGPIGIKQWHPMSSSFWWDILRLLAAKMKSRALMLQRTCSSTNKQCEQVTTNELDHHDGHVKSIMTDLEGPRSIENGIPSALDCWVINPGASRDRWRMAQYIFLVWQPGFRRN